MWTQFKQFARAGAQGMTFLALAMIALVWFGIEWNLHNERNLSERSATQRAANMARMFEEHVRRSIDEVDKTILFIRRAYQEDSDKFDLRAWVENQHHLAGLTLQIAIIDGNGILAATNVGRTTQRLDLSDREHFRVHRTEGGPDTLFVSKPVLGRASGKWSIQLTRRINGPNGSFAGVVVASLDPFRLSRFFESIDLGPDGSIALIGTDRILRAQGGMNDIVLGKVYEDDTLFLRAETAPAGVYHAPAGAEGPARRVAFRQMQDHPLLVVTSISDETIFEGSNRRAPGYRAAGAIMTVILIVVMLIAIQNRQRFEAAVQALRESEARAAQKSAELEVTLDNMSQGIIMVDGDERIAVMNRQAAALLDLPEEAFIGTRAPFRDLLAYQWEQGEFGKDGEALDDSVRAFVLSGGLTQALSVYERTRPNGTVLEVRSNPLESGGVVRTYTDITEHRRSEVALAEARDKAEAASEARSTFLATMSHEIRTPLNGVIGMAAVLEDTPLNDEQSRYVDTIRTCGEALLMLVDDVLDLSKIEAGAMNLARQSFELRALVNGAVSIVTPRTSAKGLAVTCDIADDVPQIVCGDPGRLRQILLNLLGNAAKFTEVGTVTVRVTRDATGERPTLRFEVADTGIGIPASARDRLFTAFTQVDASITRRFGGTGLGLAITQRIVNAMNGRIGFESEEGQGSTFWFEIPEDSTPADAAESAAAPEDLAVLRILVVEDNEVNQNVARLLLEKIGHEVLVASDGAAAVDMCRAGMADLVFMDMQMPVMDGLTATRAIRALDGPESQVPIIRLTANALAEDRAACLAAGMNGFVSKPVERHKLESAIAMHAGQGRAPAPETADAPPLDTSVRDDLVTELGEDAVARLIRSFWNDAAQALEAIEAAMSTADGAEIKALLHRLKGAAANVGYSDVAAAAGRIESAADIDAPTPALLRPLFIAIQHAMARDRSTLVGKAA